MLTNFRFRTKPSSQKLICVSRLHLHGAQGGVKVGGDGHTYL